MTRGAGIKITEQGQKCQREQRVKEKSGPSNHKDPESIGLQPEIINSSKKSESCLNNKLLRDEKKMETDIFVQNFKDNSKKGRKK